MTLPKEDEQRIEQEAHHLTRNYKDDNDYHSGYKQGVEDGYEQGGTKYCLELHTLQLTYELTLNSNKLKDRRIEELATEKERLRKALEELADFPLYMSITEVRSIASAALTAQPEADNQQNEK